MRAIAGIVTLALKIMRCTLRPISELDMYMWPCVGVWLVITRQCV